MMKNSKKTVAKKNIKINTDIFSAPENIKYIKDLVKQGSSFPRDEFCLFESLNNIFYLVYNSSINTTNNIIFFDLKNEQITSVIKNAHTELINILKHYQDKKNRRDLLLTLSMDSVKLWNINNLECLFYFNHIYDCGTIYSACFINDNNKNYIITSHSDYPSNFGLIKIFDFNGNKYKEINDSNDSTFFIDTYYDNGLSQYFILTGNYDYVKSYDYSDNKVYHKYCDSIDHEKDKSVHISITINDFKNVIKLIESSYDGNIRIWNFHSGDLIKKIYISAYQLNGICLWNNKYLFVGCHDKNMKLINLDNEEIKDISGHKHYVLAIKKVIHPKLGECLISQGSLNDQIKLWTVKN